MRLLALSAFALAALFLMRPSAADAQPEPVFIFPDDGAVFSEPPPVFRMCFAERINIKDLDKGGDFNFNVITPQEIFLGLRIVFRPDGMGVDVHRGIPMEATEGEWAFQWRVTDAITLEPSEGTLHFTVDPEEGSPVPEEPGRDCAEIGTPEPTPSPGAAADSEGGGDSVGTGTWILIAAAAVAGAAAAGLLAFYLIRRRGRRAAP